MPRGSFAMECAFFGGNGFRSERGAALYADIRSVVETARRRSIRAIDAIRLTLQGEAIPTTG